MLYFLILTKNINCINICIFISFKFTKSIKEKIYKKIIIIMFIKII